MGINTEYVCDQERLKCYFVSQWYCTDSYVGVRVYFFDDKPAAISYQLGRKMTEKIEWLSKEVFDQVKDYLLTFALQPQLGFALCDFDEEIGTTYKIHYHEQLLAYHRDIALLNVNKVKIIEFHKGQHINPNGQYEPSLVKILLSDGSKQWIELQDLDFHYNTSVLREGIEPPTS